MEIVKHKAPNLPTIKMTVDGVIDSKLEKHEAIKSLFSKAFFCCITGRQGSGKSSTVLSLLKGPFKKVFHDVFVVIPSISIHSIHPEDNVYQSLPDENMYNEFSEETMSDIQKRVTENSQDKYNSLLIIDDFGSQFRNEKDPAVKILKSLSIKVRHNRCSILLLTQNFFQLLKSMRENLSAMIYFDSGKSQGIKLVREILPYTEEQSEQLLQALTNPHDFLAIDLRYHRVFLNFGDELKFS